MTAYFCYLSNVLLLLIDSYQGHVSVLVCILCLVEIDPPTLYIEILVTCNFFFW